MLWQEAGKEKSKRKQTGYSSRLPAGRVVDNIELGQQSERFSSTVYKDIDIAICHVK